MAERHQNYAYGQRRKQVTEMETSEALTYSLNQFQQLLDEFAEKIDKPKKLLGITTEDPSPEEVKEAYSRLSYFLHPDTIVLEYKSKNPAATKDDINEIEKTSQYNISLVNNYLEIVKRQHEDENFQPENELEKKLVYSIYHYLDSTSEYGCPFDNYNPMPGIAKLVMDARKEGEDKVIELTNSYNKKLELFSEYRKLECESDKMRGQKSSLNEVSSIFNKFYDEGGKERIVSVMDSIKEENQTLIEYVIAASKKSGKMAEHLSDNELDKFIQEFDQKRKLESELGISIINDKIKSWNKNKKA